MASRQQQVMSSPRDLEATRTPEKQTEHSKANCDCYKVNHEAEVLHIRTVNVNVAE